MNNKSAFGSDSPFAYFHRNNAKMVMIDVDYQNSFTFVHYVEEMKQVDYRYMKEFSGAYVDEKGHESLETYSMYVRDVEKGVKTQVEPIGEELEKQGATIVFRLDDVRYRVVDLKKAYEIIRQDILHNEAEKLYFIE
jgi:aminoglycoside 3-N-acetyltransferase